MIARAGPKERARDGETWPKATAHGDHFGDAVSDVFARLFESPHLKKTNENAIYLAGIFFN
ncbi:MAG: hypothetical protein WA720_03505 [Pseudolabrys sp.]